MSSWQKLEKYTEGLLYNWGLSQTSASASCQKFWAKGILWLCPRCFVNWCSRSSLANWMGNGLPKCILWVLWGLYVWIDVVFSDMWNTLQYLWFNLSQAKLSHRHLLLWLWVFWTLPVEMPDCPFAVWHW